MSAKIYDWAEEKAKRLSLYDKTRYRSRSVPLYVEALAAYEKAQSKYSMWEILQQQARQQDE